MMWAYDLVTKDLLACQPIKREFLCHFIPLCFVTDHLVGDRHEMSLIFLNIDLFYFLVDQASLYLTVKIQASWKI